MRITHAHVSGPTLQTWGAATLPAHEPGDLVGMFYEGKIADNLPPPATAAGWTRVAMFSGGTGTGTTTDQGTVFIVIYMKIAESSAEAYPTSPQVVNVLASNGFVFKLADANHMWRDALVTDAPWIKWVSDTNTASPLGGLVDLTGYMPRTGDILYAHGVAPTDAGSTATTTWTTPGLTGGDYSANVNGVESTLLSGASSVGSDLRMFGQAKVDFTVDDTDPDFGDVTVTLAVVGSTNLSGGVLVMSLRQIPLAACETPDPVVHSTSVELAEVSWPAVAYAERLQYRLDGGTPIDIGTIDTAATMEYLLIPDLDPATTYEVELRSTNYYGTSAWSDPVEFTTAAAVVDPPDEPWASMETMISGEFEPATIDDDAYMTLSAGLELLPWNIPAPPRVSTYDDLVFTATGRRIAPDGHPFLQQMYDLDAHGWWRFEGTTADEASRDYSGNNNHLALTTYSVFGQDAPMGSACRVSHCLGPWVNTWLEGRNTYMGAVFFKIQGSTRASDERTPLLYHSGTLAIHNRIFLDVMSNNAGNDLSLLIKDAAGNNPTITVNDAGYDLMRDLQWHMIGFDSNPTDGIRLFLDGEVIGTMPAFTTYNQNGDTQLRIGGSSGQTNRSATGMNFDEVFVKPGSRSDAWWAELWENYHWVPPTGASAQWNDAGTFVDAETMGWWDGAEWQELESLGAWNGTSWDALA